MEVATSPVVCEVPGCLTTRTDVEQELAIFLASYCSVCKKDRNGRICGCIFPCSLIFKSSMMANIVDILEVKGEKCFQRKSFQICFKHPEVMTEARERVLKSFQHVRTTKKRPPMKSVVAAAAKGTKAGNEGEAHQNAQVLQGQLPDNVANHQVFHAIDGQGIQGVFLMDPANHSVLNPDGTLTYLNLTAVQENGHNLVVEAPPDEKLKADGKGEVESAEPGSSVPEGSEAGKLAKEDAQKKPGHVATGESIGGNSRGKATSIAAVQDLQKKNNFGDGEKEQQKRRRTDVLSLVSKSHATDILHSGFAELSRDPDFFADVTIVCKDGRVTSNSLLLGSASPYLGAMLKEIQFIEETHMKTVVVPGVLQEEMTTFCSLLLRNVSEFSDVQMRHLRTVAEALHILPIVRDIDRLAKPVEMPPAPPPPPQRVVTIKLRRKDRDVATNHERGPVLKKVDSPFAAAPSSHSAPKEGKQPQSEGKSVRLTFGESTNGKAEGEATREGAFSPPLRRQAKRSGMPPPAPAKRVSESKDQGAAVCSGDGYANVHRGAASRRVIADEELDTPSKKRRLKR